MILKLCLASACALAIASPLGAAEPRASGLFAVRIPVQNFQNTIDFYSVLGMRPGPQHNPERWELQWTEPLRGSSIMMALDKSRTSSRRGHASFMIHVPDVAAAAAKLKAAGYADVGTPRVTPRASILFVKDPDGNEVELLGPGSQ